MKDIYSLCWISKQGHLQALRRQIMEEDRRPCYVGVILQARHLHPGMGLRTIYDQFQPEGIGRDAFIVLGLEEGFRLRMAVNPIITTRSVKNSKFRNLLIGREFTDVNQLWVSDIFYYQLLEKVYYIVLIMDAYSRRIIGYSLADNLRAENNLHALQMALELRGINDYQHQLIHHSDRGSQYVSNAYTDLLDSFNIQISMAFDVLENAHCERINGTIKNDYLKRWNIQNYSDLVHYLKKAIESYNNRIHRSLKRKTPIEFETYIKELSPENRQILKPFTLKQNVETFKQLSFDFNLSADGYEMTIATNHLSYFALTLSLLDLLRKAPHGRIVNVASHSHYRGQIDFESFTKNKEHFVLRAYEQSKLANVLFTYALSRRLAGTTITANALHPAVVRTLIGNHSRVWYHGLAWSLFSGILGVGVRKGAATHTFLATDDAVAGQTGLYFSDKKPMKSSRISRDEALQEELWAWSEKATGLHL